MDDWARFATHTAGPLRGRDEDRVLARPDLGLFAVADGMGGHPCGDEAAERTLAAIAATCTGRPSLARLGAAFVEANRRLLATSRQRDLPKPMGCVATVVWIDPCDPRDAFIGHVGDTRAYVFDEQGQGRQLTVDHSGGQRAQLSEHDALASPDRHVVARAVGVEEVTAAEGWVDLRKTRIEPGALLLLCTDGLSDYVELGHVSRLVADHNDDLERLGGALLQASTEAQLRAGRGDNLGLVLLNRPSAPLHRAERDTLQPVLHGSSPPRRAPPQGRTGPWPIVARVALATALLSLVGAGATWAGMTYVAAQGTLAPTPADPHGGATSPTIQVLSGTPPSAALCERWGSRIVTGPVAGTPVPLVPCAEWTIAATTRARLADVTLLGAGPDRLVLEDGAQLVLDGVGWTAPEHNLVVVLGRGATLTLVASRVELSGLRFELAERSRLVVRDDSELHRLGAGPLIASAAPGSQVSVNTAVVDLGQGALAPDDLSLARHLTACDLTLEPTPAADGPLAALLNDSPSCSGSAP